MEEANENQGDVRIELPFNGTVLGFALFTHPDNTLELCMVDVEDKKILISLGTFADINEVQQEYRHFVDTFAIAMRKIDWTL
jgi:hypothetical protein